MSSITVTLQLPDWLLERLGSLDHTCSSAWRWRRRWRISTDGDREVLDLQRDALLAAGVDGRHLFEDQSAAAGMIGPAWARRLRLFDPATAS